MGAGGDTASDGAASKGGTVLRKSRRERFSTLASSGPGLRRRIMSYRPAWYSHSLLRTWKLYFGRLARRLRSLEISVIAVESGPGGEDIVRKNAEVSIVILQDLIIAAALDRNAVLGAGEFVLKAQKVFVGFQLGVILHH